MITFQSKDYNEIKELQKTWWREKVGTTWESRRMTWEQPGNTWETWGKSRN